jgi:glycerophosphoryl diester phosphodiesterase
MTNPLIFGHRGACAYAPENTLAAFNLAFELGADGIELDVTLTKDGVPVVIHDDTVDRTTDGRGKVSGMTVREIQRLDAGKWFDSKYRGEKIPTLEEALAYVPVGKIVNVELKTNVLLSWQPRAAKSSRFASSGDSVKMFLRLGESSPLEKTVVRVIEETRNADRIIVSSFNPIALYRVMKLNPMVCRGLLYFKELPIFLGRAWLRVLARPHALHPSNTTLTGQVANWARKRGYQLNTWTVDDPLETRRLAALGVNGIITNKPDVLREVINRADASPSAH